MINIFSWFCKLKLFLLNISTKFINKIAKFAFFSPATNMEMMPKYWPKISKYWLLKLNFLTYRKIKQYATGCSCVASKLPKCTSCDYVVAQINARRLYCSVCLQTYSLFSAAFIEINCPLCSNCPAHYHARLIPRARTMIHRARPRRRAREPRVIKK